MKNSQHPVTEIFQDITAYLEFLSDLGCTGLDASGQVRETVSGWANADGGAAGASPGLYNNFKKCRGCSLSNDRQQIICGRGSRKARIAIVGGIVGPDDLKAGIPYAGAAGNLLNKMVVAMKMKRDQVYITRAVKCGLPANQKPKLADINICRSYLNKELGLVKPDVICAFGEVAAMSLLETSVPLSKLRGRFHDYRGIPVMPTFSPEYLLENPDAKRIVWEDLKQVMSRLSLEENPLRYKSV